MPSLPLCTRNRMNTSANTKTFSERSCLLLYVYNLYSLYQNVPCRSVCVYYLLQHSHPFIYSGFAFCRITTLSLHPMCALYGSENWKRWLWDRLSSLGCHNSWRVHLLVKFLPFVLYYTSYSGCIFIPLPHYNHQVPILYKGGIYGPVQWFLYQVNIYAQRDGNWILWLCNVCVFRV